MGLFDGWFAPSEEGGTDHPPLPSAPFDVGGFLSGIGNDFSRLGTVANQDLNRVGQAGGQAANAEGGYFSSLGGAVHQGWDNYANWANQQGPTGLITSAVAPGSQFEPEFAPWAGQQLNRGLEWVGDQTGPGTDLSNAAMQNPMTSGPWTGINAAATYGQGIGNLLQDVPNLQRETGSAFGQLAKGAPEPENKVDTLPFGLGHMHSNEDIDQAWNQLSQGIPEEATGKLYDPRLMQKSLYNGFKLNGADEQTSQGASTALAPALNALVQWFSPDPVQKAMMIQFALSVANNPQKAWDSFKSGGGDAFKLLGTLDNWSQGGQPPDWKTVGDGLAGISNFAPLVVGGAHIARAGVGRKSAAAPAAESSAAPETEEHPAASIASAVDDASQRAAREQPVPNDATPEVKAAGRLERPELGTLRAAMHIPEYEEPNAPEDLQQAAEARPASQVGQAGQIAEAGATDQAQVAGRPSQVGVSAIAPEVQANRRPGEPLQSTDAQSAGSVGFTGEHANDVPEEVKSGIQQLLADKGINHHGWIQNIAFTERPTGVNQLGFWSPDNPREIQVHLDAFADSEPHAIVSTLARNLEDARKEVGDSSSRRVAFDQAETRVNELRRNLTPQALVNQFAAHEAVHATLHAIAGDAPGRNWRVGSGVRIIQHMDSTPEGRAWLDHGRQVGLSGQIKQLRDLANNVADLSPEAEARYYASLSAKDLSKIGEAADQMEEAFVHAILNNKELSAYPYYFNAGDKAYAQSFWNPQAARKNAGLAAAYYDKYNAALTGAESRPAATRTGAGVSARPPTSPGGLGDSAGADQARLARAALNEPAFLQNLTQVYKGSLVQFVHGLIDQTDDAAAAYKQLGPRDQSFWGDLAAREQVRRNVRQPAEGTPARQETAARQVIPLGPARQKIVNSWQSQLEVVERDINSGKKHPQDMLERLQINAELLRRQIEIQTAHPEMVPHAAISAAHTALRADPAFALPREAGRRSLVEEHLEPQRLGLPVASKEEQNIVIPPGEEDAVSLAPPQEKSAFETEAPAARPEPAPPVETARPEPVGLAETARPAEPTQPAEPPAKLAPGLEQTLRQYEQSIKQLKSESKDVVDKSSLGPVEQSIKRMEAAVQQLKGQQQERMAPKAEPAKPATRPDIPAVGDGPLRDVVAKRAARVITSLSKKVDDARAAGQLDKAARLEQTLLNRAALYNEVVKTLPDAKDLESPDYLNKAGDLRKVSLDQRDEIRAAMLDHVRDIQARIADARKNRDPLEQQRLSYVAQHFLDLHAKTEELLRRPLDVLSQDRPTDYVAEAHRVITLGHDHYMAPLKGLADKVSAANENVLRAEAAGLTPAEIAAQRQQLQWNLAQFQVAHQLYNSPFFKSVDKDHSNWKGTRSIVQQVNAMTEATPIERAQAAVRIYSEKTKKPMNLQDAGKAILDTSLGVSDEARSWHPSFKALLAGEMWHTVKEAYDADPRLPIGIDGIPVHELFDYPDLQEIHNQQIANDAARRTQISQAQGRIKTAQQKESHGTLPPGTAAAMEAEQRQRNIDWSNERARLQALLDNHPQTTWSRVINSPVDTDRRLIPTEQEIRAEFPDHPYENAPTSFLIDRAKAINDHLAEENQVTPFDRESFMRGGGKKPPPNNGQPWFTDGWADAVTNARELGGNYKLAADMMMHLMDHMSRPLQPIRTWWDPRQWSKAHFSSLIGVPWHLGQIETVLNRIARESGDPIAYSKAVFTAIDNVNESAHQLALGQLTKEQAAVASLLHEYWRGVGQQLMSRRKVTPGEEVPAEGEEPELEASPLMSYFIEHFVPHIVLKDREGKVLYNPRKGGWSQTSQHAKSRLAVGADSGEAVYRTLQALEKDGYTVEWNLGTVVGHHGNSVFRAMKIREMHDTLGGFEYTSPDGKFHGFASVPSKDALRDIRKNPDHYGYDIFDKPEARVRFGPGAAMFDGQPMHPDLARALEEHAKWDERTMSRPLTWLFKGLHGVNALSKFLSFATSPRHAFNIYSNIANLVSPAGLVDPRVWRLVYHRGNTSMLPEDQSWLFRNLPRASVEDGHLKIQRSAARTQDLLNQQAALEREMRQTKEKLESLGDDTLDDAPRRLTPEQTRLRDQLTSRGDELRQTYSELDRRLGTRDRELAQRLFAAGLRQDSKLLAKESGVNPILTHLADHTPVLKQFHDWMWRDVVWRGQVGLALHLYDQRLMRYAKKEAGWDGKGGAEAAEAYVRSQLGGDDYITGLEKGVVDEAKSATALLNRGDMKPIWDLFGRAVLVSAPFTHSQVMAVRDSFGNNIVTRKLGREEVRVTGDMRAAGSQLTDVQARSLNRDRTHAARQMVFHGTLKLAMTAYVMQAIGTWMATGGFNGGQWGNPIANFFLDPNRTFDIYVGRDPATGHPIWVDNPLYGWQRELANYVLTGVKAQMEGKPAWEVATAPLTRMSSKQNPMLTTLRDTATGYESARGISMRNDKDLQALHRALTARGIPEAGGLEDRLIYFARQFPKPPLLSTGGFPSTALARDALLKPITDINGQEVPLTDTRSLLNDFGIGGLVTAGMDASSGNLDQAGSDLANRQWLASQLGTTSFTGAAGMYNTDFSRQGLMPQVTVTPDPKGYFPEEAKRQNDQQEYADRQTTLVQLGNLVNGHDPQSVERAMALFNDYNARHPDRPITDRQAVDATIHTVSYDDNGVLFQSKGMLSGAPRSGAQTNAIINGQELTPDQTTSYEKDRLRRDLDARTELAKDPAFQNATYTVKLAMLNEMSNMASKFSDAQAAQLYQGAGGQRLTEDQYKTLVGDVIHSQTLIDGSLALSPVYRATDPAEQLRLRGEYAAIATKVAWERQFGDMKGLTDHQFRGLIINTVLSESQTVDYLHSVAFYQGADHQTQLAMEKEYRGLARSMNMNVYNGKASSISPVEIEGYMQAVINTEETAKYLLHTESPFYAESSLKEQQALDRKYETLARSMALRDWKQGNPIMDIGQAQQAYTVGAEQRIVGHLMAEQGYRDLEGQYGGHDTLEAYKAQETAIRQQIKDNVVASPSQLTRMANIAVAAFERANPQYSAFKKARTNWERGSTVGKLYLALNAENQALAQADAGSIENKNAIMGLLAQSSDQANMSGIDTTDDTSDSTALDAVA